VDQRIQCLHLAGQGQIAAKLAPLAPAVQQRNHRGEGRDVPSGEQPLANQDQEVVAEGDQARTARARPSATGTAATLACVSWRSALRRAWSMTAVSKAWRVGK
jgi:hypothetical protein